MANYTSGGGGIADGVADEDIAVVSSALPSGASTSANQTSGDQKTQVVGPDGASAGVSGDRLKAEIQSGAEVRIQNVTPSSGYVPVVDKVYDISSGSNLVTEQSPEHNHVLSDTPTVLSNIAANTTGYVYFDTSTYRYGSLQITTGGDLLTDSITLTLEATNEPTTAMESCVYHDVTLDYFGVASVVSVDAITGLATFVWILDTPITHRFMRLKYVTSDTAGGDQDLTVNPRFSY